MSKLPAFQFYPGDWRKDPALQSCSIAARGLWWEIICLLFESKRRGFLLIGDVAPQLPEIARLTGTSIKQCERLLNELEEKGVFSRDVDAVIYNRRMVRDEEIRNKRAAGGILGGNPILLNQKDKQKDNLSDNLNANLQTTPSSSTSSSNTQTRAFSDFWNQYPSRNGVKRGKADAEMEFLRLGERDLLDVLKAVANYANSPDILKGVGVRDAVRFLKKSYWREWVNVEGIANVREPREKPFPI